MRAFLEGPLGPLLAIVIGALALFGSEAPAPGAADVPDTSDDGLPATSDEARAFLSGLDVGDSVGGGWTVEYVSGPANGRVGVGLRLQDITMEVDVVERRAAGGHKVPLSAGRFDIFYTAPQPEGTVLPRATIEAALGDISTRIADDATLR